MRHLAYSLGSLAECETFLLLSEELNYIIPAASTRLLGMLEEEGRMLRGLQRSLRGKLKEK